MACDCLTYTRNPSPMGQGKSVVTKRVSISPDSSTNYTNGDSVGGLLSFDCAFSDTSGTSTLKQIQLIEKAASGSALKYAMDLVLLAGSGYSIADNAAFVAATAGLLTSNQLLYHCTLATSGSDYYVIGSTTTHAEIVKTSKDIGDVKLFKAAMVDSTIAASNYVYAYLIWQGGANKYAASAALELRLTFERD